MVAIAEEPTAGCSVTHTCIDLITGLPILGMEGLIFPIRWFIFF